MQPAAVTEQHGHQWDPQLEQWDFLKLEFVFQYPDLPLRSDNPAATVEARHGWIVLPAWEFISEVWAYERKPVQETEYEHDSEVIICTAHTDQR